MFRFTSRGTLPDNNSDMPNCKLLYSSLIALVLAGSASPSVAQTFESVGVRAQGLGGAYVAIADDATASWWNPAGLSSGAYLSAVLERGRTTEPAEPAIGGPAVRSNTGDFAVAFPALGLSYYRLRVSSITGAASTGAGVDIRQDLQPPGSGVRSIGVSQFGTTVGQSLGDHLVLGATLKLLRAGAVSGVASGSAPLDEAEALGLSRKTRTDLDVGAMARLGHLRIGVALKNVTEPTFGDDGAGQLQLGRQARAGIALSSVPHGLRQGFTVAADADLTTTSTAVGDVRHVATGVEAWLSGGQLGLRGGVSANTIGERRPAASLGLSVRVTRALHVTASRTMGRDKSVTGWSTGVNVAY